MVLNLKASSATLSFFGRMCRAAGMRTKLVPRHRNVFNRDSASDECRRCVLINFGNPDLFRTFWSQSTAKRSASQARSSSGVMLRYTLRGQFRIAPIRSSFESFDAPTLVVYSGRHCSLDLVTTSFNRHLPCRRFVPPPARLKP